MHSYTIHGITLIPCQCTGAHSAFKFDTVIHLDVLAPPPSGSLQSGSQSRHLLKTHHKAAISCHPRFRFATSLFFLDLFSPRVSLSLSISLTLSHSLCHGLILFSIWQR